MFGAIASFIGKAATAFKGAASAKAIGTGIAKAAPSVLGSIASTAFNKRQMDTSYQRTMADMKAAGINPLLAGKVGPIGSAQMADLGQTITSAKQAETQSVQTQSNVSKIDQEIENLKETKNLTTQQITNLKETVKLIDQQVNLTNADASLRWNQGISLNYKMIHDAIIAKHQQENPGMTIAKYYGMSVGEITKFLGSILKTGKK